MIDANQRWDVQEAIDRVKALAEFRPLWVSKNAYQFQLKQFWFWEFPDSKIRKSELGKIEFTFHFLNSCNFRIPALESSPVAFILQIEEPTKDDDVLGHAKGGFKAIFFQ